MRAYYFLLVVNNTYSYKVFEKDNLTLKTQHKSSTHDGKWVKGPNATLCHTNMKVEQDNDFLNKQGTFP